MKTEDRVKNEEKEVEQLMNNQEIVQEIANKIIGSIVYPEFEAGNVPVSVAAKALGKDQTWVKAGIIVGWLPIGFATRNGIQIKSLEEINASTKATYYISPKKLWEISGFVYRGSAEA